MTTQLKRYLIFAVVLISLCLLHRAALGAAETLVSNTVTTRLVLHGYTLFWFGEQLRADTEHPEERWPCVSPCIEGGSGDEPARTPRGGYPP